MRALVEESVSVAKRNYMTAVPQFYFTTRAAVGPGKRPAKAQSSKARAQRCLVRPGREARVDPVTQRGGFHRSKYQKNNCLFVHRATHAPRPFSPLGLRGAGGEVVHVHVGGLQLLLPLFSAEGNIVAALTVDEHGNEPSKYEL